MNTPASEGLGDTFAAIAKAVGAEWVAKNVVEKVTGKPCGCQKRREALNRMVPYRRTMVDPPQDQGSWG